MKYRVAKTLHSGDQVIRKTDEETLTINSIEVYGLAKVVRLNCIDKFNQLSFVYHDEIK